MAKKKQHQQQNKLTPENYIKTKVRTLPIARCLVNSNWKEAGMANIIIARKHNSGKYTIGIYLVDTFCLGLKDTFYKFNESQEFLDDLSTKFIEEIYGGVQLLEAEYSLVHNIIFGGIAFAEENNYKPSKDFNITKYILEEDDENIELIEFEFGIDGKAVLIESSDFDETEEKLEDVSDEEKGIEHVNNTDVF